MFTFPQATIQCTGTGLCLRQRKSKVSKRELLFSITRKDFKVDFFRSGGPGGQNA